MAESSQQSKPTGHNKPVVQPAIEVDAQVCKKQSDPFSILGCNNQDF